MPGNNDSELNGRTDDGDEGSEYIFDDAKSEPKESEISPKPSIEDSDAESASGSEEDPSFQPAVPKEYADKWYKQAVGCCKRKDWPSAVNAVKELFDIIGEEERTADMYCVAAVAACKTLQFKTASEYAKKAWALGEEPKYLNVRAMVYIDKYKADIENQGGEPKPGSEKYLKRADKALAASVKLSHSRNDVAMAGAASGLYAELYSLMGDEPKAAEFAERGLSLKDPWGSSGKVLKETNKPKKAEDEEYMKPDGGSRKQDVMTAVGIVLFIILVLAGVYWIYLNSNGYGSIPTLGLVGLAAAAVILIVSTVSLTFIWAANSCLRKHGIIPVSIMTALNFLCWAVVLVYIGFECFL